MVLGTGVTIVIGNGGLDLSVGSIVCLTACIAGIVVNSAISNVLVAILAAVFVGIFSGAFNGAIVSYIKVPPLITTLGTMTALRGVAYVIMKDNIERNFPDSFQFIGQGRIGIVPMPVIIGVIILLLGEITLNNTRIGKYMLAIGGNEETAKRCGIKIPIFQLLAYTISGGLAGLGGVMLASRLDVAQASLALGMELHIIAVVIIGGTYLFGGYATILGTFLGTLLMGVIENALVLIGVPFYWHQVVIGLVLITAVGIQLYRFKLIAVIKK
jgi:ribose/xylose/arabinose/galactoside ABC-type transport system permease subunit